MKPDCISDRNTHALPSLRLAILLLSAFILSACTQANTETSVPSEAPATTEPTATSFASPTPRPTHTPDLSASQACIDCHADQQRLIDTADQVEAQEVESSGEG